MSARHIFLTGSPGVGKTTLITKTLDVLKSSGVSVHGFYTEELRQGGVRIGFDVVSIDGARFPLARAEEETTYKRRPKVGKYTVKVDEFDANAIPLMNVNAGIIVIDEIGKMELFSEIFKHQVIKVLNSEHVKVFGTIPVRKGAGISFVEDIRKRNDVKIFEVTFQNRNNLLEDIVRSIQ